MTQPPRDADRHPTEVFTRPTRPVPAQDPTNDTADEISAATEPPTARRSRLLPSSWPATIGRAQTSTVVLLVLFVVLFGLYVWLRPVNTAGAPNPSRQPAVEQPSETPSDTPPATTTEPQPTETEAPTTTEPSTTERTTTPSETSEPTRSTEPQPSSGSGGDDDAPARTTAPGPDSIERAPQATFEVPEPTAEPTG